MTISKEIEDKMITPEKRQRSQVLKQRFENSCNNMDYRKIHYLTREFCTHFSSFVYGGQKHNLGSNCLTDGAALHFFVCSLPLK